MENNKNNKELIAHYLFENMFSTLYKNKSMFGNDTVPFVIENEKVSYFIDLPGVKKENVEITQEGNIVKVSAERKDKHSHAHISTTFTVSYQCKMETILAKLEDGVLEISFNIKETDKPKVETKKIEIK